ncbi:MAG: hypothetical protein ABIK09_08345 [Pseudomonadota bacterium]
MKDNLDGLISRNVDSFLTERQEMADPVGSRVFCAFQEVLDPERKKFPCPRGVTLEGDGAWNARTVHFGAPRSTGESPDEEGILDALRRLPGWPENAPRLVANAPEKERLAMLLLSGLKKGGLGPVLFKPLIDVVKREVRTTLAVHQVDELREQEASREDIDDPLLHLLVHHRETVAFILSELRNTIFGCGRRKKVRGNMIRVVDALIRRLRDPLFDEWPTQTELAHQLGIPTSTFNDLWKAIGDLTLILLKKLVADEDLVLDPRWDDLIGGRPDEA